MSFKAQIARIALTAARMLGTRGLRSELVELTNKAVNKELIDRAGADSIITAFDQLEGRILEINLFQEITGGDNPLTEGEINMELDPVVFIFHWELRRAFQKRISPIRYQQPTNIICLI